MTLLELLELTKNRIDETDPDSQIDIIVKNAINHAYLFDLSKKDKRFGKVYCPVVNGIATLPDDLLSIEGISPSLLTREKRKGNAIFSNRDVTFEITYAKVPTPLADTDSPDLSNKYQYALTTYGCFAYFEYRKKVSVAEMFLNEYKMALSDWEDDDFGEEIVNDVYVKSEGDE
jgi:hypothetical protein